MALKEDELRLLTSKLGAEWEDLATYLGFTKSQIDCFRINGGGRIENAMFSMLVEWQRRQPHDINFRKVLRAALEKAERLDLANEMMEQTPFDVEQTKNLLKEYYQRSFSRIPSFPGSKRYVEMDEIYTSVSITRELSRPEAIFRIPLQDHAEIFKESDKGISPRRLLLVGEGGSGKSLLAAKVAYDWACERILKDVDLLFILNMRYMTTDTSLEDAIFEQKLLPEDSGCQKDQLYRYIEMNSERVLIVLDSYDELVGKERLLDNPTSNVLKALAHNILRSCRILVTSRHWRAADFSDLGNMYTQLEISGFSDKQAESFIGKFFGSDKTAADELMTYLKNNNLIPGIASIPLMTQLMCLLWKETNGQQIPTKLNQLYEAIFGILWRHQIVKGVDEEQISRIDIVLQLGKIAFHGLWPPANRLVFSLEESLEKKDVTENTVKVACKIGLISLEEIDSLSTTSFISETCDFSPRRLKQTHITFFNKSFQEKMAGEYLASRDLHQIEDDLKGLNSVEECLRVQMILRFASSVSSKVAEKVLTRLIEINRSDLGDETIRKYYADELDGREVKLLQQFLELCLNCNYECESKGEFNGLLGELFRIGRVRFLGMAPYTSLALAYYLEHISKQHEEHSIESIKILELPREGEHIYYVPKSRVLEDAHSKAHTELKQQSGQELKNLFDKYVETGRIDLQSIGDVGYKLMEHNISNCLCDILLWDKFQDIQPKCPIALKPVFESFKHINLVTLNLTDVRLKEQCESLIRCVEEKYLKSLEDFMVRQVGFNQDQVNRIGTAIEEGKLPRLTALDMSRNKARIPKILGKTCQQLTLLNVSFMTDQAHDITNLVCNLFECNQELQVFRVEGNATDENTGKVLLEKIQMARNLKELGIDAVDDMMAEIMSIMGQLTNLEEIRILRIKRFLDDVLACMGRCKPTFPGLKFLSLRAETDNGQGLSAGQTAWSCFLQTLREMKQMKKLILFGIYLDEEIFKDIVDVCRENDFEFLCMNRCNLPETIEIPTENFIQLY